MPIPKTFELMYDDDDSAAAAAAASMSGNKANVRIEPKGMIYIIILPISHIHLKKTINYPQFSKYDLCDFR